MKACILGAGAIGGLFGARLAHSRTCEVSAVARGETLAALREQGWRLRTKDGTIAAAAIATGDAAQLGPQDLVVVAVKGPALPAVAAGIAPLLAPGTIVLTAMNGVPWWFFDHLPGANRGLRLESVDPGGALRRAIPTAHVIGCVVHASASRPSPGLVELHMGNHLIVGEPDASLSPRLERLSGLLRASGFEVTASRGIQQDIWYKLWGNMTMNPVSVLTGATGDRVLADPLVVRFCRDAMIEAAAIGERIGCAIAQSPEERQKLTAKLGAFRTSMLQDAEAGRPLEIDALLGVVKEIGEHVGAATPNIDALLGLIRLYGRARGLYPEEAAT